MAKFDLKGILSQESRKEMDLPEQRIVYRSPEDLLPDKENFYNTEDIADLKESIRSLGLLQALLIENRDDKDYIIAGHRRQKCCLELLNEGDERFRKIPCVYTVGTNMDVEDDDITRQIKLIQANSYRKKTAWEEMTEALKMVDLVQELRKKTEMEGKSRDIAAGLLGTSSTQIGRYKSIQTNLSDDLMTVFKRDSISLSVAAELAGLKPEYQHQAYEIFRRDGVISINDAKLLKARQEQEKDIPGQMTIEQALHPAKPQEIATAIPVDTQIDRFFEALRKNVSTYILQNNLNMTIYMLSALYGSVRVRNGHLNYQGQKEGILFNGGSDQEELVLWKDFSERLIKKYGKKQKQVKTASVVEEEPENNMLGPAKCITGQSGSGQCGAAAYCDKGYNCCAQCPDDCNGRCGWIESCQPAAELQDKKQRDFVELTEIEEHIVEDNKTFDYIEDPETTLPENWPEYLKDIPIPTETALASYLYDQERDLKQILDIEKKEPGLPHMTIMQQQMVVAGLRILQNYIENTKEPEQPPLPEMKNNDQRKEWLRNYKSWGLWYTDHHTGVRYYKYDFQNGARLIAEEYDPEPQKSSWWVPTESCYMHLVGGPEPTSKDKIPKWTYHAKYNRFPNSETELVEFLKEVQK
jgi:ParB-like chromosome segregation protein Spo0J